MDNFDNKTLGSTGFPRSQEQAPLRSSTSAGGFATAEPALAELREQVGALRHLLISVMILLVIFSGTFTIYMLRQWRTVSKELSAFRPQATQLLGDYQRVNAPVMDDFVKKITEYGKTHPDFAPILIRYGIKPAGPTGAAPAAPTAPPSAPAKK